MSPACCTLTLLFLMWLQNVVPGSSSLGGFEPQEVDGFAMDDFCRVFLEHIPDGSTSSTTVGVATASRSVSQQTLMTTETRKSSIQSPERNLERSDSKAPIRTQLAAGGPITSQDVDIIARLLSQILARGGGHAPYPQPISLQQREHHVNWKSNKHQTWKKTSSSEDSSDES